MKIKYSYTSNVPYEPLENGHPNFHHIDSMEITGEHSIQEFLQSLSKNSRIGTITNLEYSIEA